MTGPPRLASWILERTLRLHEREAFVGDLVEEFEALADVNPAVARPWIWSQVRRSILPNLQRRLSDRQGSAHHERGARHMDGFITDLRFAVRLMRRQPMMTLVGFLSLSAGLGLNLLLFTLANGILLRPLALGHPEELHVLLLQRDSGVNHNFSYPTYVHLRDNVQTLAALVAYSDLAATAAGSNGSEPLDGEVVSGTFFGALGVPLRTGRGLTGDDDRPAAPPATVISDRLWRERFGGAPLAGQTLTLNGESYTVVGVAKDDFRGMQVGRSSAFWVPLAKSSTIVGGNYLGETGASWLTLVTRRWRSASGRTVVQWVTSYDSTAGARTTSR